MTKKEIKEAIAKICDILDQHDMDSAEYEKALKDLQKIQVFLKKPL